MLPTLQIDNSTESTETEQPVKTLKCPACDQVFEGDPKIGNEKSLCRNCCVRGVRRDFCYRCHKVAWTWTGIYGSGRICLSCLLPAFVDRLKSHAHRDSKVRRPRGAEDPARYRCRNNAYLHRDCSYWFDDAIKNLEERNDPEDMEGR